MGCFYESAKLRKKNNLKTRIIDFFCTFALVLPIESTKSMKIAYIYPAFINIGGADKIIIGKANYMADEWGYEVYLITDSQCGI